jgi:hypothetical protein
MNGNCKIGNREIRIKTAVKKSKVNIENHSIEIVLLYLVGQTICLSEESSTTK